MFRCDRCRQVPLPTEGMCDVCVLREHEEIVCSADAAVARPARLEERDRANVQRALEAKQQQKKKKLETQTQQQADCEEQKQLRWKLAVEKRAHEATLKQQQELHREELAEENCPRCRCPS